MPAATGLLLDSIGLIYDSLIYPERWNDLLTQLWLELSCDTTAIALHDLDNHSPGIQIAVGISDRLIGEWNGTYGRKNPRAPEIRSKILRSGSWFHTNSIDKMPASIREDPYVHWLQHNDLYHSMVLAMRSGSVVTSLNLTRADPARPFEAAAQTLMRQLIPHLQRALQIHSRNETLRMLCEAGKFALEKIDTAVIALNEQHQVVLTNRSADEILSRERSILVRAGKLVAKRFSDRIALDRLLQLASQTSIGRGESSGGVMTLHDDAQTPVSVIVTPFRPSRVWAPKRPCLLVFIFDPAAKPFSRARLLRDIFALSPAECRLSEMLHQGFDLNAAAGRLGVTAASARFMLKRIFHKTGAHRQSQLLQLLSRLPADG